MQPWRTFIECFTLMELIGDPREMAVLDMACGEGFYTRMFRERGAARVTGVDLSQGMIELARRQEAQHQLGIEYVVGDARELAGTCQFTVNCNPAQFFPSAPSYRKSGFETSVMGEWQEGVPIKWTFYLRDGPFDIENYYLTKATHEEAYRQAGFRKVRWHAPQLSPEGLRANDQQFWSGLLNYPPVTFIECLK
jgi:SAM-dependent methyltransferase